MNANPIRQEYAMKIIPVATKEEPHAESTENSVL